MKKKKYIILIAIFLITTMYITKLFISNETFISKDEITNKK